jgi:hypothetical protein
MMTALDDSVRLTVETLKKKGMWENTFFVVTSVKNLILIRVIIFFFSFRITAPCPTFLEDFRIVPEVTFRFEREKDNVSKEGCEFPPL